MKALLALLKDIDYSFHKEYSIVVANILSKTKFIKERGREIPSV